MFVYRWILGVESTWEPYAVVLQHDGIWVSAERREPGERAGAGECERRHEYDGGGGRVEYAIYRGRTGGDEAVLRDGADQSVVLGRVCGGAIPAADDYELWGTTGYPTLTDVLPGSPVTVPMTMNGAASDGCTTTDGTETSPTASSATGLWNAVLCAADYTAWRKTTVNANTSWTMEVTALNESGAGSVQKLQPVIGVWNLTDAAGTLPTVASAGGSDERVGAGDDAAAGGGGVECVELPDCDCGRVWSGAAGLCV